MTSQIIALSLLSSQTIFVTSGIHFKKCLLETYFTIIFWMSWSCYQKNSFHLFHMNVFLSAFKTFNSGWWDSLPFSLTSIFILKLRFENLKYREKINWSSGWSMAAIFSPVRKLDFFHINLFSPNLKIIHNLQEFDYLKGLPVRNVSQIFHWDYRKTINHMLKLKSDLKKKNLSHVFYSVIC